MDKTILTTTMFLGLGLSSAELLCPHSNGGTSTSRMASDEALMEGLEYILKSYYQRILDGDLQHNFSSIFAQHGTSLNYHKFLNFLNTIMLSDNTNIRLHELCHNARAMERKHFSHETIRRLREAAAKETWENYKAIAAKLEPRRPILWGTSRKKPIDAPEPIKLSLLQPEPSLDSPFVELSPTNPERIEFLGDESPRPQHPQRLPSPSRSTKRAFRPARVPVVNSASNSHS